MQKQVKYTELRSDDADWSKMVSKIFVQTSITEKYRVLFIDSSSQFWNAEAILSIWYTFLGRLRPRGYTRTY